MRVVTSGGGAFQPRDTFGTPRLPSYSCRGGGRAGTAALVAAGPKLQTRPRAPTSVVVLLERRW